MYLVSMTDWELVVYAQGDYDPDDEEELVRELSERLEEHLHMMAGYKSPSPEYDDQFGHPHHGHDDDDD
jgi:hypothetical protein